MSDIPANLLYASSHEWISASSTPVRIGISQHAQEALGDITFVELPAPGTRFGKGETFGVVESVKAASDLYMPASGTVIATNPAIEGDPGLINRDPYGEGWLLEIEVETDSDLGDLLSPEAYRTTIAE